VESLRKLGRLVSCDSSVLIAVALVLDQFEGEVNCGKTPS
jgi:hypothetical protein